MAQRAWLYILVGLLISSFLGGAVRVFFSPARVREIVEKVVLEKQPKFNIDFDSARLELAGAWWPSIAIELSGIQIKAKEPCITNSSFQVDRLIVPFQLSSLLDKKIKFGHVSAGDMRIYLRPTLCESTEQAEITVEDGIAPLERFFQKRWSKELINTTRFLDKLSIERLELLRDNENLSPANLKQFEMVFLADEGLSKLSFAVELGAPWVGKSEFGLIETEVHIRANEVQLFGEGNLKEGQFQINGKWAVDQGEASINLLSRDVPMLSIMELVHHWGVLKSFNPILKNQWASCDMGISGDIRKFRELELKLHQCRLYGDFGEINLKTTQINNLMEGGVLSFLVQDVDVKRVLSAFDFAKNWGLVSNFGRFTGVMNISGKNTYELNGSMRDFVMYISHLKAHARQKIDSAQVDLAMAGNRFSGRIFDFLVEEGSVAGGFSFNFSPAGDGLFQFSLDKVIFPPQVQKAIWGGEVSASAVYGKGSVEKSEIKQLAGDLALVDLKTESWAFKNIKSKFNYSHGRLRLSAFADEFYIFPNSNWSVALPASLSQLKTELDFVDGGGHWINFSAFDLKSDTKFESIGEWTRKNGLMGELIASNKNKIKHWSVGGAWTAPQLKALGSP